MLLLFTTAPCHQFYQGDVVYRVVSRQVKLMNFVFLFSINKLRLVFLTKSAKTALNHIWNLSSKLPHADNRATLAGILPNIMTEIFEFWVYFSLVWWLIFPSLVPRELSTFLPSLAMTTPWRFFPRRKPTWNFKIDLERNSSEMLIKTCEPYANNHVQ